MRPGADPERGVWFFIGWAVILLGIGAGYYAMWCGCEWAWGEFVAEWE